MPPRKIFELLIVVGIVALSCVIFAEEVIPSIVRGCRHAL